MTKHVNHLRGGMTLRSKVLGSGSAAAVSVLMLSSAAFAANSPVDSDAPIATNANNSGTVLMAQVAGETAEQAAARRAEAAAAARRAAEDADDDVIVVTGIRSSLENAQLIKKKADNFVDAISSEGIGKFPDLNLGEAIQRIPGVQITRDDFRRGNVTIRGLPGLASTVVNGQHLAAPNFSGGFAFGIFEANVISAVEVNKTPKVSMDAGGIAGVVNLRTRTPLEFKKDKHLYVRGGLQHEQLAGSVVPEFALSTGMKNAAGDMGFYVTGGYQRRDYRFDSARISYFRDDPNGDSGSSGGNLGNVSDDLFVPRDFRLNSRHVTGDRLSLAGGAEWQVNDEFNLNLTGLFSKDKAEQPFHELRVLGSTSRFRQAGTFTVLDSINSGNLGTTATSIRYDGPRIQVQDRVNDETFQTWAATLDGEWERGPWNVKGALHTTEGTRDRHFVQVISRFERGNGVGISLNTGGTDPYGFDLRFDLDPSDVNSFGFANSNPNQQNKVFSGSESFARFERENAAQIDITREVNLPLISSFDFGGKYRHLEQELIDQRVKANGTPTGVNRAVFDNLGNDLFQGSFFSEGQGFFGGELANQGLVVPDARRVLGLILPVTPGAGETLSPEGFINNPNSSGLFNNKQDIMSLYANANFEFDAGSIGVRGNAGVRYVDTSRTAEAIVRTRVSGGSFVSNDVEKKLDFDHVLPQINLIYDIGDNLVVRTSYSKTLTRPNPNSFRAANAVTVTRDDVTNVIERIQTFTENSGVLPFTADGLDFGVEWYNREGSSFTAAFWNKKIKRGIERIRACPATIVGVEDLITGTPRFVSDDLCEDEAGVEIVQFARFNTNETKSLTGIEIGMTQNLGFLEGFWSDFGMTANYSFIADASEIVIQDGREVVDFPGISQHAANVIGYYETDKLGIRLAYAYRSDFLAEGGSSFVGGIRTVAARSQWDLSTSYNVSDKLKIGIEAFNLFDKDRHEFQGDKSRFRFLGKEGRTFTISASYDF